MKKKHLSVLGIGPIYVGIIVSITIIISIIEMYNIIPHYPFPINYILPCIGIIILTIGIILWIMAVISSKLLRI